MCLLEKQRPAPTTEEQGRRLDAGSRLVYTWDEDTKAYVFAQATVEHTGSLGRDNRVGVGGRKKFTDRIGAESEISIGDQGPAANAMLTYEPTAESRYYLGYRLDAERNSAANWPFALIGDDVGTIVTGANHRISEQLSVFAEDTLDIFGKRQSIMQSYGVTYTPSELWTFSSDLQWGNVYDNTRDTSGNKNPDIERVAVSGSVGYNSGEGADTKLKLEYRRDKSEDVSKNANAYLLQYSVGYKVDDDWRAIGSIDAVYTDAVQSIRDGKYIESSFGFAYRPTTNDKLNALVKLTYLQDQPGADQVTADGTTSGSLQRSQILNADISYDFSKHLTIGAKYGMRHGQIRDRAAGSAWEKSEAHLAVLRGDFHVVKQWDLLAEGRVLWSPTTDETEIGALLAIYREINDNMRIGFGYNFGRFSDDLRDLTYDDSGVFVNLVGKF